jgi:hypothetical protein
MSWLAWFVALQAVSGTVVSAQETQAREPDSQPEHTAARSVVPFVGGAASGFLAHEGGHLVLDVVFDADPGVKRVSFGGVPFFAITHHAVTPRQEYAISSAGFWVQHATSEWILMSHPDLRHKRAPYLKGWLAWNVLASAAYATAAFGQFGPPERDPRGMAQSLGIAEPWVGAMIAAPAALDGWRYYHPRSRWAAWTSRAVKVGLVVATVSARAR